MFDKIRICAVAGGISGQKKIFKKREVIPKEKGLAIKTGPLKSNLYL